jgi:hypothetical protein
LSDWLYRTEANSIVTDDGPKQIGSRFMSRTEVRRAALAIKPCQP